MAAGQVELILDLHIINSTATAAAATIRLFAPAFAANLHTRVRFLSGVCLLCLYFVSSVSVLCLNRLETVATRSLAHSNVCV